MQDTFAHRVAVSVATNDANAVACPYCGAERGYRCQRNRNGRSLPLTEVHKARAVEARRIARGTLGYRQGKAQGYAEGYAAAMEEMTAFIAERTTTTETAAVA